MTIYARWNRSIVDGSGNVRNATVAVYKESDGLLATIYSDRSGATPKANPFTLTGADYGLAFFHAAGAAYKIVATDGSWTQTWRYEPVGLGAEYDVSAFISAGQAPVTVTSIADLKALSTAIYKVAFLNLAGKSGHFIFLSGNYASLVTADAAGAVYLKADDTASSSGAWVRVISGQIELTWFGAVADNSTDNATAIQRAITFAQSNSVALHIPGAALSYNYSSAPTVSDIITIFGDGADTSVLKYTGAFSGFVLQPSTSISDNNTFWGFSEFSIVPSVASAGTYGIYAEVTSSEYLSKLNISRMRVGSFGTAALFLNNAAGIANGGFFTSQFVDNFFESGILGISVGDSLTFARNTITGQGKIDITQISGARQLVFRDNNITLLGGTLFTHCYGVHLEDNWFELPAYLGNYTGSASGYVTLDTCENATVQSCTIQPLAASATTADYALSLSSGSVGCLIDSTEFGVGEVSHINLNNATGVVVRENNKDIAGGALGVVGLVGNSQNYTVGVIDNEVLSVLTSTYNGSDVDTAQPVFLSSQDTLTLLGSTTYEFEAEYQIDTAGTNSHSLAVLFGGTATFTSLAYSALATNGAGASTASAPLMARTNSAGALTVTAAVAAATQNTIRLRGIMRINAAGTIIPQFQYSAAPGAAPAVRANSFFRAWAVGTSGVATVGPWG